MPNYYQTSNGERVSEATIKKRLRRERGDVAGYADCTTHNICQCYGAPHEAVDCDHTISQKRCKELHKTELIWYEGNWSWSSRRGHEEWERYKSGKFQDHLNFKKRMLFVLEHDREGFIKRMLYVTRSELAEWCNNQLKD